MTEQPLLGDVDKPITEQAVWVEPVSASSVLVRQRVRYENGEQVETETPFKSLSEALTYANSLCRDDTSEKSDVYEI
jgi:hypothetical protein